MRRDAPRGNVGGRLARRPSRTLGSLRGTRFFDRARGGGGGGAPVAARIHGPAAVENWIHRVGHPPRANPGHALVNLPPARRPPRLVWPCVHAAAAPQRRVARDGRGGLQRRAAVRVGVRAEPSQIRDYQTLLDRGQTELVRRRRVEARAVEGVAGELRDLERGSERADRGRGPGRFRRGERRVDKDVKAGL